MSPVTLGCFFSGRHSCFESLAFKQGKTINYQAPLQACLKNKTMRSKWPNSHSPDIPYRKLKHQVLQNTKVGHGGSSKNQHCEFLTGIHRPEESILSCQSLRSTSEINTRGVQCPAHTIYWFCRGQGSCPELSRAEPSRAESIRVEAGDPAKVALASLFPQH